MVKNCKLFCANLKSTIHIYCGTEHKNSKLITTEIAISLSSLLFINKTILDRESNISSCDFGNFGSTRRLIFLTFFRTRSIFVLFQCSFLNLIPRVNYSIFMASAMTKTIVNLIFPIHSVLHTVLYK